MSFSLHLNRHFVKHLLKVNNSNTSKWFEISSKLTIKTLERYYWRHSGVFIVNFEHISYLFHLLIEHCPKVFCKCLFKVNNEDSRTVFISLSLILKRFLSIGYCLKFFCGRLVTLVAEKLRHEEKTEFWIKYFLTRIDEMCLLFCKPTTLEHHRRYFIGNFCKIFQINFFLRRYRQLMEIKRYKI